MAVAVGYAEPSTEFYRQLTDVPSGLLFERGNNYRVQPDKIDSAMVCYTILGNRYEENKTNEEENILYIKAYCEKAFIYYFHYFDYPNAFASLGKAKELMQQTGLSIPEVYLYEGLLNCSIGEQTGDYDVLHDAMHYLRSALYEGHKEHSARIVNIAFANLVSQSFTLGMLDSIEDEYGIFETYLDSDIDEHDKHFVNFNDKVYTGLQALSRKDYAGAQAPFDELISRIPRVADFSRYLCGSYQYKGIINAAEGKYAEAVENIKKSIDVANEFNQRDNKIELYRLLADYYGKLGMNRERDEAYTTHLAMKDSLVNYRQAARIGEIRLHDEMRRAEQEIATKEMEHKKLLTVIGVILAFAILLIIFLIMLWQKTKRINATNRLLFNKNEEAMRADRSEKHMMNVYQQQIDDLRERLASMETQTQTGVVEKYKNSSLTDEEENEIYTRIVNAINGNEEVYSAEFSLERLAELTETNYKYVSQTINEKTGQNFNKFVNSFRINEACKRLRMPEYTNLTIDALGESVGFRSRSTFVSEFKRITGLTPSQYSKEIRREPEGSQD